MTGVGIPRYTRQVKLENRSITASKYCIFRKLSTVLIMMIYFEHTVYIRLLKMISNFSIKYLEGMSWSVANLDCAKYVTVGLL